MNSLRLWSERSGFQFRRSTGQSILKIVLKTKNDAFFIDRWIQHHAAIVGYDGLIILDNASDDEDVLRVYEAYADRVEIIRFNGFHNDIHDVGKFPRFYAALAEVSLYYIVIDTDEFLYFYDGSAFCSDPGILAQLVRNSVSQSVPTTWMYNAAGFNRRAVCGVRSKTLHEGLLWGKPIMRSAAVMTGYINHNCQLPLQELTRSGATGGFFLMHMAQLSPRQRVRANINKLVARGFAEPWETAEMVLSRDAAGESPNVLLYLAEIRRLLPMPEEVHPETMPMASGLLRFGDDGAAEFASGLEATLFNRFFTEFPAICAQTLTQGRTRMFAH